MYFQLPSAQFRTAKNKIKQFGSEILKFLDFPPVCLASIKLKQQSLLQGTGRRFKDTKPVKGQWARSLSRQRSSHPDTSRSPCPKPPLLPPVHLVKGPSPTMDDLYVPGGTNAPTPSPHPLQAHPLSLLPAPHPSGRYRQTLVYRTVWMLRF